MIYLGENKINKIGNGNRLYIGNNLIYQYITDVVTPSSSLPNVAFLFNFNAKEYNNGIIPNAVGSEFMEDCVITNSSSVVVNDDYITLSSNNKFQKSYSPASNNIFSRSGSDPLTIIAKVKGISGQELHLIANRDYDYNYMLRVGTNNIWLHTLNNSQTTAINVPIDFSQPNIFAIRCQSDGKGFAQNYTTSTIGDTKQTRWGATANCGRINFFDGGSGMYETFNGGDFYWMYASKEQLTDEQIQQVINYNENL